MSSAGYRRSDCRMYDETFEIRSVLLASPSDGLLGHHQVSLPGFQLCCDLASPQVAGEEDGYPGCRCRRNNTPMILSNYPVHSHLSANITVQIFSNDTQVHGGKGKVCKTKSVSGFVLIL
ncbi:hypothetical protein GN956_G1169 [Arapaima gigas]